MNMHTSSVVSAYTGLFDKTCSMRTKGSAMYMVDRKTVFPADTNVQFTNIAKQLKAPFVVYADFESVLEAVDISTEKTNKFQ